MMIKTASVKAKLILAFMAVASFVVVSSALAFYAFVFFGQTLDKITEERLPPMILAQQLAAQSERIIASAPALIASVKEDERKAVSDAINAEVGTLSRLVSEIRHFRGSARTLTAMESDFTQMVGYLREIDDAVRQKLGIIEKSRRIHNELLNTYRAFRAIVKPAISISRQPISELEEFVSDHGGEDMDTDLVLSVPKAVDQLMPLLEIHRLGNALTNLLLSSATERDVRTLRINSIKAQSQIADAQEQTDRLNADMAGAYAQLMIRFKTYAIGDRSLPELRRQELGTTAEAQELLEKSRALSERLNRTVNEMIRTAEADIRQATLNAKQTQRLISAILVFVAAASLVFSALMGWVYVGQQVILPINRVVRLMRKVSEGDLSESADTLKSDLDRKDEIGTMTNDLIRMTDQIRDVLKETDKLIHAVQEGNLEVRGNDQRFSGAWSELVIGMNNVLNTFMGPFRVAASHIDRISAGEIPEHITETYKGDFNKIRNNLNMLIDATLETAHTAEEIAAGNLTVEVRERSEQDRMMKALNQMIRKLKEIANETNGMIRAVGEGHLNIRGNAEAFDGGWRDMVAGVNDLIRGLSHAVSKSAALSQEMELARRIQTVLLPKKPKIRGYEIAAIMEPSEEVGGDYYDVISVGAYDWIVIGDVSGHGVTAGLVMMMVQTAIHTVLNENSQVPPSRLLSVINKTIYDNIEKMDESKHITIVVLAAGRDGVFSFSGLHEDILIRRAETGKVEIVKSDGMWIGLEPDISEFLSDDILKLESGDCLVLFTDGITEAFCEGGKLFGDERLIGIVEKIGDKSAWEIRESVIRALESCETPDDVTLVVTKRV